MAFAAAGLVFARPNGKLFRSCNLWRRCESRQTKSAKTAL